MKHIAERISHQDQVYAAAIFKGRKAGVIAGQHGDLFCLAFHAGQLWQGDRLVAGEATISNAAVPTPFATFPILAI